MPFNLNPRRIKILQVIIIAFIIAEFIDLCLRWQLLKKLDAGFVDRIDGNLWLVALVSARVSDLALLLFVASVCLFLNILYKALPATAERAVSTKLPGRLWAVICWFIPVVNIWVPFLNIKNIVGGIEGGNNSKAEDISKVLLYIWWLLWILVCLAFTLTLVIKISVSSHGSLAAWLLANLVTQVLAIIDCFLFIRILGWFLLSKEQAVMYEVNTDAGEPLLHNYEGLLKLKTDGKIQDDTVIVDKESEASITYGVLLKRLNIFNDALSRRIVITILYCGSILLLCIAASMRSWNIGANLSSNVVADVKGGINDLLAEPVTVLLIFAILYSVTWRTKLTHKIALYIAIAIFITAILRGFLM